MEVAGGGGYQDGPKRKRSSAALATEARRIKEDCAHSGAQSLRRQATLADHCDVFEDDHMRALRSLAFELTGDIPTAFRRWDMVLRHQFEASR